MRINFWLPYDNEKAHSQIKLIMKQRESINLKFRCNSDNIPCATVETSTLQNLMYQLSPQSWQWLLGYLENGIDEDFGIFPMQVSQYKGACFQFDMLKSLIETGYKIQFAPMFRETLYHVSAVLPLINGKIFFRLERTNEIMNYIETIKTRA